MIPTWPDLLRGFARQETRRPSERYTQLRLQAVVAGIAEPRDGLEYLVAAMAEAQRRKRT